MNKADIAELERVQRRATKVITGMGQLQYPERVSKRFVHKHRKGFFTVRAVRLWNSLPEEVVSTIKEFKRGLDVFLEYNNITGYSY